MATQSHTLLHLSLLEKTSIITNLPPQLWLYYTNSYTECHHGYHGDGYCREVLHEHAHGSNVCHIGGGREEGEDGRMVHRHRVCDSKPRGLIFFLVMIFTANSSLSTLLTHLLTTLKAPLHKYSKYGRNIDTIKALCRNISNIEETIMIYN